MDEPADTTRDVPCPANAGRARTAARCIARTAEPGGPVGGAELDAAEWGRVFRGRPPTWACCTSTSAASRSSAATWRTWRRRPTERVRRNLLTSGLGLTSRRAGRLKAAGVDSVQISFQADETTVGDALAGVLFDAAKPGGWVVRKLPLPLTLNVVLHRGNIDRVEPIVALAEELDARRLELANVQFYGWAVRNRGGLVPTREQVLRVEAAARAAQRLAGRMDVVYVPPDYFADRLKPCMHRQAAGT